MVRIENLLTGQLALPLHPTKCALAVITLHSDLGYRAAERVYNFGVTGLAPGTVDLLVEQFAKSFLLALTGVAPIAGRHDSGNTQNIVGCDNRNHVLPSDHAHLDPDFL